MENTNLDIVIDIEDHLQNLKQKVQTIRQDCSEKGIGGQKYLSELYICFKQHMQEFSKEIYTNLIEEKSNSKELRDCITDAGAFFVPIYQDYMKWYSTGGIINSYDKASADIEVYESKLNQFLIKQADKFSKKYTSNNKPFWKKWEFWGIAIPSIMALLAFI